MATNLDFWATRDERAAKAYWESKGEMYRGLLADALRPLAPFASVLEIGCHSGPNLWAIRQRWPDPVLYGGDPALKVAMFGAAMCALPSAAAVDLSGIGFFCGSAPSCFDPFGVVPIGVDEHGVGPCDKATLPDVDVIVSCYTLAYLTPEQLDSVSHAVENNTSPLFLKLSLLIASLWRSYTSHSKCQILS